MKRYVLLFMLGMWAVSGAAQKPYKWKPPKQPKRAKWVAPKQMAPEVIDVWRPYGVADNWFLDLGVGGSFSMAENMKGHDLEKVYAPAFEFGLGKLFSPLWATRFAMSYKQQKGWVSPQVLESMAVLVGDGDYGFKMVGVGMDEMFSVTDWLFRYSEKRRFNLSLFIGGGLNYSFGFDSKVERWYRYGYPVDNTDQINVFVRGGISFLYRLGNAADLVVQGAYHLIDDNYNGVRHSATSAFDSFADVTLGVRVHLMDHYGDYRYYKVRRWEATSLRGSELKVAKFLDDEKLKEYRTREEAEVVAFGELMKTRISFYVDRSFVNDYQMENLRIVADFLKAHPEVNLVVKGYSGASTKKESPTMRLAERRVESVKKVLLRYYDVDPSRFEVEFDEQADAPFPMVGEWIDGVVFLMVER